MDRKNQTEHEILNMHDSRFSGEERARMAEANSGARRRSGKNGGGSVNKSREKQGADSKRSASANSDRNKNAASVKKNEGSRNDKVRTSTKQRKKEKKRQNNLLAALLFISAVAAIGIACVFVLKINTVEIVNGSDTYSNASIAQHSGIEAGESMLLINTEAAKNAITTNLPFIENAVIERQWPDKVVITVEYAETAMVIDSGSGYILLSRSCKVLDNDAPVFIDMAAQVKGVKVLSCVPGSRIVFDGEVDTDSLTALVDAVEENGIEKVSCYDLTKITDIVLMIDRRIEVKLGTLASAADKLGFCREVIKRTLEEDSDRAILIDITADGTAYARVKDDNHVNYGEEPDTEETASDGGEAVTAEVTTASFSVG